MQADSLLPWGIVPMTRSLGWLGHRRSTDRLCQLRAVRSFNPGAKREVPGATAVSVPGWLVEGGRGMECLPLLPRQKRDIHIPIKRRSTMCGGIIIRPIKEYDMISYRSTGLSI